MNSQTHQTDPNCNRKGNKLSSSNPKNTFGLATKLHLESLESRELMSVTSVVRNGTALIFNCDNSSTSVRITQVNAYRVQLNDLNTGATAQYWMGAGHRLVFVGGDGNDQFINATNFVSTAHGNGGNDILTGSTTANDILNGGAGNDIINGRGGADSINGGDNDDTLIAIDATTSDYIVVGTGTDVIWCDLNSGVRDRIVTTGFGSEDTIHAVPYFSNPMADRTLTGDRIIDPGVNADHTFRRMSGYQLFGANGPQLDDINQGGYGDCWLLAGLGAIAQDSPNAIRRNIVDFGDGTYGVKLGNKFYRVDDDLPVYKSNTNVLAAAGFGHDNSIWVAIYEKAYTHFRYGQNSYQSIEGGWAVDVNELAFNSTTAGTIYFDQYANSTSLLNDLFNRWNTYQAVSVAFYDVKTPGSDPAPLVMSHQYIVAGFNTSGGNPVSVILRNPWGIDGGGNSDSDIYDGFVTVTAGTLWRYIGAVDFGKVI